MPQVTLDVSSHLTVIAIDPIDYFHTIDTIVDSCYDLKIVIILAESSCREL